MANVVLANNESANNAILAVSNNANAPRENAFTIFHGVKRFSDDVSVEEALSLSGLDFVVGHGVLFMAPEKIGAKVIMGETPEYDFGSNAIESHKAIIRTDTNDILGIVGADYGIVQNQTAFEFLNILMSNELGSKMKIVASGSFDNGKRVFIQAKMADDIFIGGRSEGNRVNDYILFSNGHDGSRAFEIFFTPIRVVCQNTLNMALNMSKKYKNKLVYKHTKNVADRVDWSREENLQKAVATLEMHRYFKEEFVTALEGLNRVTVNDSIINEFASAIYLNEAQAKLAKMNGYNFQGVEEISTRSKNLIYGLKSAIEDGIGQQTYRGTALWLLNGLTTYYQNGTRFSSGEVMANSILDGDVSKKVQKGYDFLQQIAA